MRRAWIADNVNPLISTSLFPGGPSILDETYMPKPRRSTRSSSPTASQPVQPNQPVQPSQPVQPVQPSQPSTASSKREADDPDENYNKNEITDFVFSKITELQWRDLDDGRYTDGGKSILKFNITTLSQLFDAMIILSRDLRASVQNQTGLFGEMDEEMIMNILFHAIAKGYSFYMQAIVDAEFMTYLSNQHQPLYTFMRKKLKR